MSASTVTFEPTRPSSPPPGRLRRLLRGPAADPRWARPALLGLLALTALLYLWDLSRNGYANDFYAAAVHHFRGLIAFGVCLVLTSGALLALHAVSASPGRGAEIAVLVAANLVATALRFVLYRGWVFAEPKAAPAATLTAPTAPRQSLGDVR